MARSRRVQDDFDGAWKNMLTEKRFAAFLAFFHPEAYALIDWVRPVEFLEQELRAITRKTKRGHRAVDRLVKVWLNDGSESWVLVHIEIQSQKDDTFPLRMFQYRYRALDLFGERPIACLAILGDPNADWKPQRYTHGFLNTRVTFDFGVVKLLDFAGRLDELEQSNNPFARFVVAHLKTVETQGDYESRLEWKIRIIQGLYVMGVPEEEIGQLCHDFDWLLALPEPLALRYHTTMTRFEEVKEMPHLTTSERIGRKVGMKIGREEGLQIGRLEGLQEGRQEGLQEGRLEGRRELLMDQLSVKFGPLSSEVSARVNALTSEELDSIGRALLAAPTLQDLGL
ncbi:MAG: hypothetical protein JWL77_3112 [Chthonomonadaceae bacterium]|nr:hypothetical protein [Chthonomonadaceae bacterium]